MQIEITENRSTGQLRSTSNAVRVFVNKDYAFGYWVPEQQLFDLLSEEQQTKYLTSPPIYYCLDVPFELAQRIIDIGVTPYPKEKLIAPG